MSVEWTIMRGSLKRHLLLDHNIELQDTHYVCSTCEERLGKRPSTHRCVAHDRTPTPPPPNRQECEECGLVFLNRSGLKNHMAAHALRRRKQDERANVVLPQPNTRARRKRAARNNNERVRDPLASPPASPASPGSVESSPHNANLSDTTTPTSGSPISSTATSAGSLIRDAGLDCSVSSDSSRGDSACDIATHRAEEIDEAQAGPSNLVASWALPILSETEELPQPDLLQEPCSTDASHVGTHYFEPPVTEDFLSQGSEDIPVSPPQQPAPSVADEATPDTEGETPPGRETDIEVAGPSSREVPGQLNLDDDPSQGSADIPSALPEQPAPFVAVTLVPTHETQTVRRTNNEVAGPSREVPVQPTHDDTADLEDTPEMEPANPMTEPNDEELVDHADPVAEDEAALHRQTEELKVINTSSCSAARWDMVEQILEDAIKVVHRHVRIPERPQDLSRAPQPQRDPGDAAYIQKLYKRNRRQAMRLILDGNTSRCAIPKEQVHQHFTNTWTERQHDPDIYSPSEEREELNSEAFTPREIRKRLRKAENTAPGKDRITYNHWRSADADCLFLCELFNACRKYRKIPSAWKDTVTVLIHKKGPADLVGNWRPIALCNTAYKIYTGCWSARLSSWIGDNNILSHCQKGFMPHDGVMEHNFMLNSLMREARKNRSELCVAWLDLTNAFGSIPHSAITRALECAGAGHAFVEIIKNLYSDNTTTIITEDGPTESIPIRSGIKQGCPISGLLFNLAIDPVVRALQRDNEIEHSALAFADDLALISKTPEMLQEKLNLAVEETSRLSIELNAGKSATLHLSGKTPVGTRPTQFTAQGTPLRMLRDGEATQFLGCPVGYSILPSRSDLKKIMDTGLKILTSMLAPWQRLDALRTFFYPSLTFAMRTTQHSKTEWDQVDKVMRAEIKKTLSVPQEAANEFLHGSRNAGSCGIPVAAEESDFATIDSAFKLLTSRDPIIQAEAMRELDRTVNKRLRHPGDDADRGNFMSGSNTREFQNRTNEAKNHWTTARTSSTRQQVQWRFQDREPTISRGDKTLRPAQRFAVIKTLRTQKQSERDRRLRSLRNQGKTAECVGASKSSSHFLYTGEYTRFKDWRFIHKARLNLVPLNGAKPWITEPLQKKCRRCGAHDETLPHVICHCMRQSDAFQRRHNNIVERVKTAASVKHTIISENQAVAGTNLRPDLIIARNLKATIIDVAVTFENQMEALQAARELKITKYAPLRAALLATYTQVDIEAVIVGALGSWDPKNDRFISKLCSRSYARKMKQLCVSDTIRWSRDIYAGHLSGEREYGAVAARPERGQPGRRAQPPQEEEEATPSVPQREAVPQRPSVSQREAVPQRPAVPRRVYRRQVWGRSSARH